MEFEAIRWRLRPSSPQLIPPVFLRKSLIMFSSQPTRPAGECLAFEKARADKTADKNTKTRFSRACK